jgi:hypothetical protein
MVVMVVLGIPADHIQRIDIQPASITVVRFQDTFQPVLGVNSACISCRARWATDTRCPNSAGIGWGTSGNHRATRVIASERLSSPPDCTICHPDEPLGQSVGMLSPLLPEPVRWPLALGAVAVALLALSQTKHETWFLTAATGVAVFFTSAMVAHRTLYEARPAARYLTEFYLWMSFGGALGGLSAALIAPKIFSEVFEYPLLLALAACGGAQRDP